jgi:S-adenosylmethionine:tRNA-ribosyltransferase-isomerase (queuine synthetase)
MTDTEVTTEERLIAEGWTRQFNTDEPRLSEAVEMYGQMGLEVHLEPVVVDPDSDVCQMCYEQDCHRYQTIWTRPKGEARQDEDLF